MLQLLGLFGLFFVLAGPLAGTAYADDGAPPPAETECAPDACEAPAPETPPQPAPTETECLPDPADPESCAPSADESTDPPAEPASDEPSEQPADAAEPQPECTPNPDDPGACQPASDDAPADPASSGETCDPEVVDCQLDIPLDLPPAELSLPEDGTEPAMDSAPDEDSPAPAADPYLFYGGTQYSFTSDPFLCLILPNCTSTSTPVQAAIDFAEAQYATAGNPEPDGNTIYIEPDTYFEASILLDGIAFDLRLLGQGGTPTLSGVVSVTNSSGAITLENLILSSALSVQNSGNVSVIGTSGADTIQVAFAGSGSSGVGVDGLGGSDSLYVIGTGTDDTITPRLDSITLGSEVITFTGVETVEVYGMSGNDTFALDESSLFTGALDGGADTDTISYASWSSALNIDLNATPYPGLAGTVSNVERVQATSFTDTLTGPAAGATFYAQTTNNSVLVNALTFLDVETVAAGAGTDTLDASALSAGVTIDLGGTSGFTGILWTGFENAIGGSGNDTLISSSGNNVLDGGLGDDDYVFFDAWGTDAVTDPGGTDTFWFTGVTTDLAIGLDFTAASEDITITTTGGSLTLSGVPFIERFFAGTGNDAVAFNAGGNRMTYEISGTQVALTYVPTTVSYLFQDVESYTFPNTLVAFTAADETLLVGALQAFTDYMYALEGYSYLATELPGLFDTLGNALTLAALLEPGDLLQTYLVDVVSAAISTNWTLQEVADAITGALAAAGVSLNHGLPSINWQFNCTAAACVDLATIQMLFWISRNQTVKLSLNQNADLAQQGLLFDNELADVSLYADLYYSLRFGLSKQAGNAFVDDLVPGYASPGAERFLFYTTAPVSGSVAVDVVYGFLRVTTEDFSYSISQFLDIYATDPTALDGHTYTADWNTITADLPDNTLGYVSAPVVAGAGYSVNLGIQAQAVGEQVPNLGFDDWTIQIVSANIFEPATVTIVWDTPSDAAVVTPFVNTTADQVYDLLGNLAAWLTGYSGSDQFDQVIPFTEALLLGQLLNFGVGFSALLDPLLLENGSSAVLCDPYDPGAPGAADDGTLCFRDARQLAEAIDTILAYALTYDQYFEYDTTEHVLTYDISFMVTTSQAVPVYMGYDLTPFSGLQISGTVLTTVTGDMIYDFKLAFDLDANLEAIIRTDVGSVPTLMAYQLPVPLDYDPLAPDLGRTSQDITFTIQIEADSDLTGGCLGVDDPVGAPSPDYYQCTFNLTLLSADTAANTTIEDLVLDLNNMFGAAGLGSYLEATVETGSDLLYRISALPDQGINSIAISASDADLWQIGLAAPTVYVSAENIPYTLGSNLTFTATLYEHGGASNVFVITVDAAETAGNTSLEDLIADINFAIAAVTGASSQIKASRMLVTSEEQIGLYALSGAVEYMTVTPNTFFVNPLLVKDIELPAVSPLVDGVTSDFSVQFVLAVDNVAYTINASFLTGDTLDDVITKLNAALNAALPPALDDQIRAEPIFDERVGGVCPAGAGYGDVMRTDPFTGDPDGTGLVLYHRNCYSDRIALVAQDLSITLMVIKSDVNGNLRDRLGLDVGLYGRRGSNHLALLGLNVDADGDLAPDPYLHGTLDVDVCTFDGVTCGGGFDATMLQGFAGLTIVDAALPAVDASLAFGVRLHDPSPLVSGVALDVLLNNAHDEDIAAPGTGFDYVTQLILMDATAGIDLPVVAQPGDAAFGIVDAIITLTFPDWFTDPVDTAVTGPVEVNLGEVWHADALEDVTFAEVIGLFQGAVDYLNALHADPTARLTVPLPFISLTVRQLLDYAPIFAAKVAILAGVPVINAQQFLISLTSVFPGATFLLDPSNWTDLRFGLTDNVSGSLDVPLSIYFPSFQDPANPFVALEGVQRLYAANEAGYLTVDFSAALNLSGGLNTLLAAGAQRGFLDDTSTLTYSVSARATDIDARLKLSYLDMYTHTCSTGVCAGETGWVAFDGDGDPATIDSAVWSFGLIDNDSNGRHYLNENLLATTSKNVAGAAILRLPLFHPDPFTFADELYPVLAIHVPNLGTFLSGSLAGVHMDSDGYPGPLGDGVNPLTQYYQIPNLGINAGVLELGSTVNDLLKNVEVLLGGLDTALIVLQNAINEQVFGQRLPFLGDALATLPAVQIFEIMRLALMQDLLDAILAADPNLDTAGTIALIQGVILTSWAGVLTSPVTIVDQNGGSTCAEDPDPDVLSFCEFHMDLGDTINTQIPFDIMLDGLGLTVDATVDLSYVWAWDDFTFGINSIDGFYLDVSNLDELTLDLDGSLVYTGVDSVTGTLTFLPFDTLGTTTTDADPEAWSGVTGMDYQIVIDVRDPDNSGRFTFAELADAGTAASQVIYALLNGTYDVHLQVLTSFDGSALFPNLQMDFNAVWTFTDVELDPYRPDLLYDDKPDVQYWNVRLDFGTFLSQYLRPVLDAVFEILQPFAWLIDPQEGFLWQVDPVMSFLSGQTMRIIDEIELLFTGVKQLRPFLNAVAYLYGLAKQMNSLSPGLLYIPIGALSIPDYSGSAIGGWLREDIEDLMVVDDTGDFSFTMETALGGPGSPEAEYSKSLCKGSTGANSTSSKRECEATAGASLGDFSIDFPILSDPGQVLLMLAGQDADLVVVNLPALQLSASIEFKFMVYTPPPVWVKVGGTFQAEIDIDFGFDTRGIRTYMITGLEEDIADGFYIIVRDPDTGERVPQLTLTVRIEVGASVSLAILEVGVGGGIEGTAYFYLHDPNNDGKVRWKEIAEVVETNGWIFDVRVKIDLFFNVYVNLDFVLFSITVFDFEVRITVFDKTFNITLPPRLGTTVPTAGGYLLYLNMGAFAGNRFTGDLFDGNEIFTVWQTAFDGTRADLRIRASINGAAEYIDARITAYKNIVKVIAFGGEGNDGIDATGLSIPVEFHGGNGNDTLTSSNHAGSKLWGDDGDDTLNAGSAGMWMNGGNGNDTLNGGAGADTLLGSSGNDTLNGNGGNDGLTGGAGDDILNGGLNDDTYFFASYSGNDTLLGGDSGVDTLDFQAAFGELGGEISAGRISLTGLGYSVNSNFLEIERVLGSRGGGAISVSAAGPGGLFLDGRDGSDVYSVFLGSDFLGPMTVQDTGAPWYVDRLGVHTDQLNDVLNLSEGGGNLTVTGTMDGTAFQPFSFPSTGHGLEYFNIFLHGGDDVYNASGVGTDLDELPIVIRPDDTDSKGTDTLTGGAANETFLFSRAWGDDTLTTAGGGIDTLDFHILDDPLAISLGADGGVYINSLLLNTDADDPLTEIDVLTGAAATGTVKAQDLLSFTPGTNDLTFDWATIEVILGSRRPNDVLAGRDQQGVWQLGLNNENTYTAGGHEIVFKYIEVLQGGADVDLFDFTYAERQRFAVKGGAGDDIFRVRDDVLLTDIPAAPYFASAIRSGFNGQTGLDVLDFSYYTTPVTPAVLNLGTGFLSHIVTFLGGATAGRLLEIDAILGTALADVLLGNATAPTTFIGSAGNDSMTGGSGNDHFISGNLIQVPTADFLSGAATTVYDPTYDQPGTDGADVMNGLGGSDTYNFDNDWDTDTINDSGGALDTLEFMDLPGAVTVTPGANTIQVVYGLNTFSAAISGLEWVIGTTHDDTFVFGPNTSFTGKLDGYADLLTGPDNDLLDFSAYHTGLTFQASSAGTLDGIQGAVPGPLGAFDNINDLMATAFADTFQGTNNDDIFTVNDTQVIFQTGVPLLTMVFDDIEILNGRAGMDTFNIQGTNTEIIRMYGGLDNDTFFMIGDAIVPGRLDGDDDPDLLDIDTLDYSLYDFGAVVDLVLGQATGIFGDLVDGLFRIEKVVGSSLIDTIYGDQFDNILVGDDGLDRLIGRQGNDTYVFSDNWGQDEVIELPGQGTDKLDFSGVTVDLTFTLGPDGWTASDGTNTVTVTTTPGSTVDGEHVESFTGGSGYNLLDVSAWTGGGWDVFITGPGSIRDFAGTLEDLSRPVVSLGTFDNLSEFVASPTAVNDRLTGDDVPGLFNFTATQTDYSQIGLAPNLFIFSNFDTLRGGADDDTFALVGGVTIPQFVDGQAGSDTLDYNLFTTSGVTVDFSIPSATALTGGLIRVENAIGTPVDDSFTGDGEDNTFDGGDGNDTYIFTAGWGADTVIDSGNVLDTDTLDFSALNADLTVSIFSASLSLTDGLNTLDVTLNTLEEILTGSGDDQFIFMEDGAEVSNGAGSLDAGLGINLIDYQGYSSSPADVDLVAGTAAGTSGISNFRDIFGGDGNDTLTGDGQDNVLRGRGGNDLLTGDDGNDTLDESWATANLTIDLSVVAAQLTGIGSDTISEIENLVTGSGDDTLCGSADDNLLQGGLGDDTYCFYDNYGNDTVDDSGGANDALDFSALTLALTFNFGPGLTVAEGLNLVTDLNVNIEDLIGGLSTDLFVFANGAVHAGSLDGGPNVAVDTIDWSAYTTPRNVVLSGPGTVDGMTGTEAASGAFDNIDFILGGSAADAILGANAPSDWNPGAGTYATGGQSLGFGGFENLNGNADTDTFEFTGSGVFTGNLNGGGGTDVLDYQTYPSDVSIDLQAFTSTDLNGTFSGIESLLGSAGGNDTLTGRNAAGTFELDGTDRYLTAADTWDFSGFETLMGGTAADTFQILANVTYDLLGGAGNDQFVLGAAGLLNGFVDGGIGTNTLDLSALAAPRSVLLTAPGASAGFDGQDAGLSGGFLNITNLIATAAATDALQGIDQNATWNFGGTNTYSAAGRTLQFSAFEFYTGGAGDDVFSLGNGVLIPGDVDAGPGIDTLDLSAWATDVFVDLASGIATGIGGLALNFENANGGAGDDFLYGNALNNILNGNDGNDYIDGRDGDDTLITGRGVDTLVGGPGIDTGIIHWLSIWNIPFDDVEILIFLYPPAPPKPPLVLLILVESGQIVPLDCDLCVGFRLLLLGDPLKELFLWKGAASAASLTSGLPELPKPFDDIYHLVDVVSIALYDADGNLLGHAESTMQLTFIVPLWLLNFELAVLHWDEALGQWVVLHPDEVDYSTGRVTVYVEQVGVYLLVVRAEELSLECDGEAGASTSSARLPNGDRIAADCTDGATLRLWPVAPWLLDAELVEQMHFGWETQVVGLPEGTSLPLTITFGVPAHMRSQVSEALLGAGNDWTVIAFEINGEGAAVELTDTGVLLLMLDQ